jgi:hypothetical protein
MFSCTSVGTYSYHRMTSVPRSILWQCLQLVAALSVLCNNYPSFASATTTVQYINIASMMFVSPTSMSSMQYVTIQTADGNLTALHPNYTDPGDHPVTSLQPGWQQGLQLYRDTINDQGGFLIDNLYTSFTSTSSNVSSNGGGGGGSSSFGRRVKINIDFFPVANTTDTIDVQTYKMQQFINHSLYYTNYTIFVAPPTTNLQSSQLSFMCEIQGRCVLILPIIIDDKAYICAPNATGSFPEDCIARNRFTRVRRWDYTWSTAPPSIIVAENWIDQMSLQQAQSMAIIKTDPWIAQAAGATRFAQSRGIQITTDLLYDSALDVHNETFWRNVVRDIRDNHPADIWLIMVGYTVPEGIICGHIGKAFKDLNFHPKAVGYLASCTFVAPFVEPRWIPENLGLYSFGVTPFDPLMQGTEYRAETTQYSYEPFAATNDKDSPAIFVEKLVSRFGLPSLNFAVISSQAALAPWFIHKALETYNQYSWSSNDIMTNLKYVSMPSHYGRAVLDSYGRLQDRPYPVTQITLDGFKLIAPAGKTKPIYPAPTWDEREFHFEVFNTQLEITVLIATSIVMFYGLVILMLLILYRQDPVVRSASPLFCYIIIIGSLILLSTIYVWPLQETDFTCMAKVWTLLLGFTLQNAAQTVKTYRLMKIFYQERLKKVKITNSMLGIVLGATTLFVTIYILFWQLLNPLKASLVVVDPIRPKYNYYTCDNNTNTIFAWVIPAVIIALLPLMINCILAFKLRNIHSEFNETTHIGASIFVSLFISLIIFSLVATTSSRDFSYAVRSSGLIILSCTTMTLLFIPKLMNIWSDENVQQASDGTMTHSNPPPNHPAHTHTHTHPQQQPPHASAPSLPLHRTSTQNSNNMNQNRPRAYSGSLKQQQQPTQHLVGSLSKKPLVGMGIENEKGHHKNNNSSDLSSTLPNATTATTTNADISHPNPKRDIYLGTSSLKKRSPLSVNSNGGNNISPNNISNNQLDLKVSTTPSSNSTKPMLEPSPSADSSSNASAAERGRDVPMNVKNASTTPTTFSDSLHATTTTATTATTTTTNNTTNTNSSHVHPMRKENENDMNGQPIYCTTTIYNPS